jgi:hypothetical protein
MVQRQFIDASLIETLKKFGQEHLIKFMHELSDEEKEQLVNDLESINFKEEDTYFNRIKSSLEKTESTIMHDDCVMQPVPSNLKGSFSESSEKELEMYEMDGLKAISENY